VLSWGALPVLLAPGPEQHKILAAGNQAGKFWPVVRRRLGFSRPHPLRPQLCSAPRRLPPAYERKGREKKIMLSRNSNCCLSPPPPSRMVLKEAVGAAADAVELELEGLEAGGVGAAVEPPRLGPLLGVLGRAPPLPLLRRRVRQGREEHRHRKG